MKVLAAVIVPPHLSVSGGARAAERLSAALSSSCDMTIASMMNGIGLDGTVGTALRRTPVATKLPPLVPWRRLSNRYSTLFYRSDLPRIIARGKYDLVHLHNPMPALELERAAKACLTAGTPYVVSTHGFNEVANGGAIHGFDRLRNSVWQQLAVAPVSRTVRRAADIFTLSEADVPIVREMGFRGETTLVPNGVMMPEPVDARGDQAALAELGIAGAPDDPARITCMFLANHTPNKGLPDLLAAIARMQAPVRLIVAGERRGAIDYDSAIARCRADQQIIITGRVSDAQVEALFRLSDLFVFPTLADTFPLVVLEAMSHGVAVLASRVGGIPHQIDESCGMLVPASDPAALAAALDRLASEPARLVALGQAARARVAARFTWGGAAARALAGYEQVLRRCSDRSRAAQAGRMASMPERTVVG